MELGVPPTHPFEDLRGSCWIERAVCTDAPVHRLLKNTSLVLLAQCLVSMMQYPAFPQPLPPQHSSWGGFHGGPMSSPAATRASPAATRASASVPVTASSTPEVTVARISVSSPTWFSHCDPTETRCGQIAERARSPREGKTTEKAEEPREGTTVAKLEATTMAMIAAPTPTSPLLSAGHGANSSVTAEKAPPEEATAL